MFRVVGMMNMNDDDDNLVTLRVVFAQRIQLVMLISIE